MFAMNARTRQNGVALIELMIAMVILAIGLLGAVGLQARSLSALSNASARVDATIAAEKLIGLMWTDQANLATYVWNSTGGSAAPAVIGNWMTETRALLPNATAVIIVTPPTAPSTASQVSITITWQRRAGVASDKNADQVNSHTIVATVAPTS
jgi:type IV pilus assembly protein PilV